MLIFYSESSRLYYQFKKNMICINRIVFRLFNHSAVIVVVVIDVFNSIFLLVQYEEITNIFSYADQLKFRDFLEMYLFEKLNQFHFGTAELLSLQFACKLFMCMRARCCNQPSLFGHINVGNGQKLLVANSNLEHTKN